VTSSVLPIFKISTECYTIRYFFYFISSFKLPNRGYSSNFYRKIKMSPKSRIKKRLDPRGTQSIFQIPNDFLNA